MLKKLKKGIGKKLLVATTVISTCLTSVAFASTTDFTAIETSLTGAFSVAEISAVIGTIIGTGVAFVLTWWGARKLVNAIISAFKSGKLKF